MATPLVGHWALVAKRVGRDTNPAAPDFSDGKPISSAFGSGSGGLKAAVLNTLEGR